MAGQGMWLLKIALAICIISKVTESAPDTCAEGCWEACFQVYMLDQYRYKNVYDDLYAVAMEITQLKNIYNIKRVAFLIDSAVSDRHDVPENNVVDERLRNGEDLYKFEILLAMALSLMVNGQNNYIIQYDEESAWTCDEFSCLPDGCTTVAALNEQTPVEMTPTSFCPGNIEAACRLAQKQILEATCTTTPSNSSTMVIAITNGDFHLNTFSGSESHDRSDDHICPPRRWGGIGSGSSSSSEEFFSPCHSYFDTRYVIGTHTGSKDVFDRFPSFHGNYRYIHAEQFSYDALRELVSCQLQAPPAGCCAAPPPPITVTGANCKKTQGPFGEITNPFPTHAATNATYGVFVTPLALPLP